MKRATGWERWKDAPAADRDVDADIGGLLRKAGRAPVFSDARMRRVERQLWATHRPRGFALPALRWAVAAAVLVSAGALTAGVIGPARVYHWATSILRDAPEPRKAAPVKARPRPARVAMAQAPAVPVIPTPPAAMAAPVAQTPAIRVAADLPRTRGTPAPEARPLPGNRPSPASPAVALTPAVAPVAADAPAVHAPSEVPIEAELLGRAIEQLRRMRDAAGALATLDEYSRRFPAGALRSEAALVRIDALLAHGDLDRALEVAEATPTLPLHRRRELQLIEAERIAASDCAAALARFDFLLRGSILPGDLRERALYGRANCHVRTGDRNAARRDLHGYLAEFPSGRFAVTVREALQSLGQ